MTEQAGITWRPGTVRRDDHPVPHPVQNPVQTRISPRGRQLLEKVIDRVLEQPDRLDMEHWFTQPGVSGCGTVACIAGLVCLEAEFPIQTGFVPICAKVLLSDLDDMALNASFDDLFHTHRWPLWFLRQIMPLTPQTREYAEVTAERIRFFIETDGYDAPQPYLAPAVAEPVPVEEPELALA